MPTRAAASAHCRLRWSVGATTVMRSMIRRARSSAARRSAKVVLPAPGVAAARKSRGSVGEVLLERLGLPRAQLAGGAPGGALGERRVRGCSAAEVPGRWAGGGRGAHWIRGVADDPRTDIHATAWNRPQPGHNGGMVTQQHPWSRYVAIGDSFTEGIGDPEPGVPGGHRGWADRVAEVLSQGTEDFAYANLAMRGKLIQQIIDEQIEPALALRPDLITISAGGNDVIRPRTDPDEIAARFEYAIERLSRDRATIVLFTGVDVGFSPVFRGIRGKVAIYNENLRAIAQKYDCIVADQWALAEIQDQRMGARPAAPQRARPPRGGAHGAARAQRRERPPAHEARAAAGAHLAAGPRRGPLVGARVPRAVGAASHPPPVVRRPHHREATGCRALRRRIDALDGPQTSRESASSPPGS